MNKRPNQWAREIRRRGRPMGVKFTADRFQSKAAAEYAGQRALTEFLDLLAKEKRRSRQFDVECNNDVSCATSTASHQPSRYHPPFRVINRYVGNLPPMPGVFADYPAPVIRNTDTGR